VRGRTFTKSPAARGDDGSRLPVFSFAVDLPLWGGEQSMEVRQKVASAGRTMEVI